MSWQTASLALLSLALAGGFACYEREKPPARVLALVATLAALAVVGRLAFAAIPNVKPTTDIVLFAGYALGAAPGFAVGAVTALVSNIFLSQGPWTAWQMAGWGAVGVGGAVLARVMGRREPNRFALATVCALAGLAFGAWMDAYQWTLAARQDLATYIAVSGTSLPYNLAHAGGNFVFCLLLGPAFVRALRRYRRRLEVRWKAASAGAGAAAVVLTFAVAATAIPSADAAVSPTDRAARYLLRAQNADGGFGAVPGQRSSPLFTGWTGLGLAAAGRNPRDVHRRGGRSITAYLRRGSRSLRDIGEIERTILLIEAAGLSSRRFGGRNLVAQVEGRRRRDGSIAGFVSYTAFGILALRAAGEPAGRSTVAWLVRSQNSDGGFGVAPSSGSDSDMTGAALQALAVTGRARSAAVPRAVAYLRGNQRGDGGFGQMRGRSSNAQSTAYAVQGLVAVRAAGGAVRRGISYLRRLQRRDGSVAYSRTSAQTPVWVTAQALAAMRRKPLPLATVPRRARSGRGAPGGGEGGGGSAGGGSVGGAPGGGAAATGAAGGDSTAGGSGGSVGGSGGSAGGAAGSAAAGAGGSAAGASTADGAAGSGATPGAESPDAGAAGDRGQADEDPILEGGSAEEGSSVQPGTGLTLDPDSDQERASGGDRAADGGFPAGLVAGSAVVLGLLGLLLARRAPRRTLARWLRRARVPRSDGSAAEGAPDQPVHRPVGQ